MGDFKAMKRAEDMERYERGTDQQEQRKSLHKGWMEEGEGGEQRRGRIKGGVLNGRIRETIQGFTQGVCAWWVCESWSHNRTE